MKSFREELLNSLKMLSKENNKSLDEILGLGFKVLNESNRGGKFDS